MVVTIVGARPQFIKVAAVSRAIKAYQRLTEMLVHTGKHYDANTSDVFFDEVQIWGPYRHLGGGVSSRGQMTDASWRGSNRCCSQTGRTDCRPMATNSTLAGVLAVIGHTHSYCAYRGYSAGIQLPDRRK